MNALLYQELAIEETRRGDPDPVLAAELLASKALEAGIDRFVDREKLDAFLARAAFAAGYAALPRLGEEDVKLALQAAAAGLRSFDELRSASVLGILEARLSAAERSLLEQVAPERIRLPRGRSVQVHYETGKPPWIASRLQDFFGMKESPRVARGAVPVVLHLLAPNQRPVQTTTDLAGFWERLYPQVRRELCRRYPKHSWPESPHS